MSLNNLDEPVKRDRSNSISDMTMNTLYSGENTQWSFENETVQLSQALVDSQLGHESHNQSSEQSVVIANRMVRLLEVLPGGVVVLDGRGIIQQCNAAAIDLLGEPLEGCRWSIIIKRAFAEKNSESHDIALKDGRLVHISTSPLDGEPGQIILLHDVTETRQLQVKVAHLKRLSAMGEMAARLAHQIRTPLSSALLYIAPLLKEGTQASIQQRFAKKLHTSISHMERLVQDMLAFSRGDMAMTAAVSTNELLSSVVQAFDSQSDEHNIALKIHNSAKTKCVYGSKDALTSALTNLVNNARLACEQQGEINIYAELIEDTSGKHFIEISVEDDGVGIPIKEQKKVLDPFYTTRSSGTGLGLAVVQSIATAHKGSLWFASDEGEGSTFCLRLPLYQTADDFALKAQKQRGN
jgi:two-component system sensor histidine kinase FlrB